MEPLPETITRWCCEGKSCGNTTLKLIGYRAEDGSMFYDYVRVSTGATYTWSFKTEEDMRAWLAETEGNMNDEV